MPADREACSSPHAVTTNVFFTSRNMSCQISTSFQSLGLTTYTQLCYLHFIKRRVSMIQIQFQQFYLCKITWGNIISSVYPSSPFLASVKKKKKKRRRRVCKLWIACKWLLSLWDSCYLLASHSKCTTYDAGMWASLWQQVWELAPKAASNTTSVMRQKEGNDDMGSNTEAAWKK